MSEFFRRAADSVRNFGSRAGLVGSGLAVADAVSLVAQRGDLVVQNQNFRFPLDIKDQHIHMRFVKYERRSINQQPFLVDTNGIRLPIPSRLSDNVSVNYNTESLGPAMGAIAEFATTTVEAGSSVATADRTNVIDRLTTGLQRVSEQGAGALIGTAAEAYGGLSREVRGALSSVSGLAVNPFQTILFSNPNFKKHNFSWRLVPRSPAESEQLENIIRLFKYHMLPGVGTGGVFFTYPEMLIINLRPESEYLYKFKPCVVETVNVNYAPNGPSFYRDTRAPTAVDLSIELQEVEIWTKLDYMRGSSGPGQVSTVVGNTTAPTNLTLGG